MVVKWVEGMCKLHTFYITNVKHKLPYYAVDISENQLCIQMIDSIMKIGDELEEVTEADFEIFNDEVVINMKLDTSQVYNLDITKEMDLEFQIFNIKQKQNENDQITSQRWQAVVLTSQYDDFDIEALAREIIDNK